MTKDEILALNNIGLWEAVSHVFMQHPKDVMWRTSNIVERIIGFMETQDIWFELSNVIPNSDPIVYECKFEGKDGYSYACEDTMNLAVQRSFVLYMNKCFEPVRPFEKSDCEHYHIVPIVIDKDQEQALINLLKGKNEQ